MLPVRPLRNARDFQQAVKRSFAHFVARIADDRDLYS